MQIILILTVLGLICGIVLVIVDTLSNNKNNSTEEIKEMLPGLNCGSCGYGSCEGMAKAILEDIEAYKKCRPLRGEKKENLENYLNKKNETK